MNENKRKNHKKKMARQTREAKHKKIEKKHHQGKNQVHGGESDIRWPDDRSEDGNGGDGGVLLSQMIV